MKRVFIILGLISAALALTLSVTPQFQLAFIPAAAALIFALVAFFIAKNQDHSKKTIHLVFLLSCIAFGLTSYKSIFNPVKVEKLEATELKGDTPTDDSEEVYDYGREPLLNE